jgi:hypothetical protein
VRTAKCMRTRPEKRLTGFIGRGTTEVALSQTAFELRRTPYMDRPWSSIREGGINLFPRASTPLHVD